MSLVLRELSLFFKDIKRKINLSAEANAKRTDPVYVRVDEKRINANYKRIIPASISMVLVEICGTLYNLISRIDSIFLYLYIGFFAILLLTTIVTLCLIEKTLRTGTLDLRVQKRVTGFFWSVCTLSLIACSFFEAVDTGTLFQYLIYLISFTLWPTFKPNFAVPYYLVAFTAQLGYMVYARTPFISILFMFGITVFCVVGNYIKFAAYMDKHLAIEKLELLAEYDTLTELLNRRGMRKRSELLMDYSARVKSPVTVAMVDVDFFKSYNDNFGHKAGDRCLQLIAGCIRQNFRRRTDLSCRYGGEEFLVVFVGQTQKEAADSLLHLQKDIERMGLHAGDTSLSPFVTVSVGAVCTTVNLDEVIQTYIQKADENLYHAKQTGRNCICLNGEFYRRTPES